MAVVEHITNMPSAKHSGRRKRTQLLVLHSAECPLQRGYAQSLTEWANGPGVEASWHNFAGPGTLVRAVNTYMAAWHASVANPVSIGSEQAGYAAYTRDIWLSKDGRDMIERLAREWAADAAIFNIEQRWLATWEVRAVLNGNTSITGLCTHAQIDPGARSDPGPNYPYDLLLSRIKAHSTGLHAGTVNPIKEDTLSAAEVQEIKDHINAVAIDGYTWNGKRHAGTNPIITETQKRVDALTAVVAQDRGLTPEQLETAITNALGAYELKLTKSPAETD